MATVQTDQVTLTVNGQSVTVPKGTLILDAAKKVGIDIPIFCSHPKMAPVAVCRMCLVEVEKMPKLQPACAVYVAEGMVVKTTTDQGNCTEICPVGALTSRQYRFISRPWDLDRTPSVCPGCSMGCNIQIDARNNKIGRFQSRENVAVDDSWLCDFGRYSFPNFQRQSQERPRIRRGGRLEDVSYDEAIAFTVDGLKRAGGQAAGWASPADTNEELLLFRRLFREVLRSPHLDHRSAAIPDAEPGGMTLA